MMNFLLNKRIGNRNSLRKPVGAIDMMCGAKYFEPHLIQERESDG